MREPGSIEFVDPPDDEVALLRARVAECERLLEVCAGQIAFYAGTIQRWSKESETLRYIEQKHRSKSILIVPS